VVSLSCEPVTANVRAARIFVADHLAAYGEPELVQETAALLVGEVAANAVLHAGSPFTVEIATAGDRVRIEVCDQDPTVPTCQPPQPGQVSGWGMHLVDKMATRWGAERIPGDGKCVWFELATSPAEGSTGNGADVRSGRPR
jgi:anti-sigma regulatory factor (Ser/Thr protein kinase)